MRKRSWSKNQLINAVKHSYSIRQVLHLLGLKTAGGNYSQIKKFIRIYKIDNSHFKGKAWNKGRKLPFSPRIQIKNILVVKCDYQSFKLKKRLFRENLKKEECELCGWSVKSDDGRIPVELDHINGDRLDNRLENLRILCPNCHSLQPTHRGRNIRRSGGGTGIRARLKSV